MRGPRAGRPAAGPADREAGTSRGAGGEEGPGMVDEGGSADEALGYVAETPAPPEPAEVEQRRAVPARTRPRPVAPDFPAVDRRSLTVLEQDQGMRYAIGDVRRIGLAESIVEVRRGFLVLFLSPGGMSVPSAIYNLQRLYLAYLAATPQQDSVAIELREEGELYGWFTRAGLRYAEAEMR